MDFPIKPLITLLAIVNPIGVIPFFIRHPLLHPFHAQFQSRAARENDSRRLVHSFCRHRHQCSGGPQGAAVLRHLAGLVRGWRRLAAADQRHALLNAQPAESSGQDVDDGASRADSGASIAVVPLTIPLLTGPASISTVVIYAEKARDFWQLGVLVIYGLVIGLATWSSAWQPGWRFRRLVALAGSWARLAST